MDNEGTHRKERKRRFTLVLVPESETGKPKRMTMGILGFASIGVGVLLFVGLFLVGALVYTPLGLYVPIPNPELENRYHKQIVAIQEQLSQMTDDLKWLREYNVRLRKALGERLSTEDSSFVAIQHERSRAEVSQQVSTAEDQRMPAEFPSPSASRLENSSAVLAARTVEVDFPLTMPVVGYITQEFDPQQQHFGIDFAGKEGSPIYAAADGSVIFAGWTYEDGYMIMIAHGSGYRTTYKHNQALLKNSGEYVRRGEVIALLGNSGKLSYGPHLHFEVWKDDIPRDPREFLLTTQ